MYNKRFTWLKQSESKDASFGQEKETFTDNGKVWGEKEELTADERIAYGGLESQADVKIRLRNRLNFSFKDRLILHDVYSDDLYYITGVLYGVDETILIGHRSREL